jgi:hypothetical protein
MVFNGKLSEMDDLGIPLFRKCPSEEVSSRFSGFLVASPCLWGKVVNGCNVVFSGRRGISRHSHVSEKVSKIVLCDGRNTVARFCEDDFHFSWQARRCACSLCAACALL